MKVLLTGATGLVGQALAKKLNKENISFNVLTRDVKQAKEKLRCHRAYKWHGKKELPPKKAFDEVTAVIHLAGENISNSRWTKAQKEKIKSSRVQSTLNLAEGINKYGKNVDVFICSSAIGYYPVGKAEELDETASVGEGFLSEVCQKWEEATKTANTKRIVQMRTAVVLSSKGGALTKLLPIFKLGLGGPIGFGQMFMSWIHLNDLVELFVFALKNINISGPINASAPNPVTNLVFSKELAKKLNRPCLIPVPPIALKLAFGEMSSLMLDSQKVIPQKALDNQFKFKFDTIEKALEDICHKGS